MSSSSSFESDSNSSSSNNNSLSMTKQLLDEPLEEDSLISTKMTRDVVQNTAIHVPIIVSTMLIGQKYCHEGSTPGRCYIHRDRKEHHDLIINDYFKGEHSKYTAEHFRRRFRMDVELFKRILQAIENSDDYFTQKVDAVGKDGLSPLQKMIAAVRMLAYGCPADLLDEYVQIGESTAVESLKHFCDAVRKDVERAFGVLQSRWHIVKGPTQMWNAKDLRKIVKTCIILHNMIIESEHNQGINLESWQPHGDEMVEDVHLEHDYTFLVSRMLNRMKQVQDKRVHKDLKIDLINHLWDINGGQHAV